MYWNNHSKILKDTPWIRWPKSHDIIEISNSNSFLKKNWTILTCYIIKTKLVDANNSINVQMQIHTHTHLMALCLGQPRWAGTRIVKPIWILPKQETVSGSGCSWDICKYAPHSRQITMPAPHHSVFYRPDALPATQPTASKHWRQHINK